MEFNLLLREAQAFKIQGAELAEAERLERDAKMRRERAVAHGGYSFDITTHSCLLLSFNLTT